ncbi:hypothetical protein VHTUMSATKI_28860 [Vibrio harveyi]
MHCVYNNEKLKQTNGIRYKPRRLIALKLTKKFANPIEKIAMTYIALSLLLLDLE